MAVRGRKPKPTALRILEGNPGRRPFNKREARPDPTIPACPNWLNRAAKAKWRELVPMLRDAGLLTSIDGDALTNYCDTWSRWREAVEFIKANGSVMPVRDIHGKAKEFVAFPQVTIARSLVLILNRYQSEFGMTPSARSRLEVTPRASEASDFMGLIQGKSDG